MRKWCCKIKFQIISSEEKEKQKLEKKKPKKPISTTIVAYKTEKKRTEGKPANLFFKKFK